MFTITARQLMAMTKEQLWDLPHVKMKVVMDDGHVITSRESTIFSVYCWKISVLYPKVPLLVKHHLGNVEFEASVATTLINRVVWDCYDLSKQTIEIETIETAVGELLNEMYNDFTYMLEEYVQSITYQDALEIVNDPEVKAINEAIQPTYQSIDKAHRRVSGIIKDPTRFKGNAIADGCRSKTMKLDQAIQCVSARGFLTDIDSNIFRKPILPGYVHGFTEIVDLMMDSRQASKALGNTDKPLQDSQYFNRRLQMLLATVSDIIPGDCGSKNTMPWHVNPEDVNQLDGKYYVERGRIRRFDAVTAKELGLVGKVLNFRTILKCESMHPRGFCETCFGEMRHSIPAGTLPGHVAATHIGEKISQILLSTKHLDRSASSNGLEISTYNQQFIKMSSSGNSIVLADVIDPKTITLTFDAGEASRLPDVNLVDDVNLLQTTLVSSLSRVQFTIRNKKNEERVIIPIMAGKHTTSISKELLQYIKETGWVTTSNGNYSIDLKKWDQDNPLFAIPAKNANMSEYLNQVDRFLKSGNEAPRIADHKDPFEALREFHSIVSTRLMINIAYLEIVVLACMVRSVSRNDYRLPLPGNQAIFGKFATIVAARSASAMMAYQYQKKSLNRFQSYLVDYRPNHPFDALMIGMNK